jgi:hypothetical protein
MGNSCLGRGDDTSILKTGRPGRIVILKGNAGRLAYINEFVEQAKASGLVQKAIDHAGRGG